LSGDQDPSKNNDRNGKREVTININLDIKVFPRLRTRWRSRWFPGGHPPFPKRKPDPDSPDYDDTKPFRFDDDFRFRVDEFGDDDYFDEEGQS
jgi:hypothetical protein|tara:strand:+ start:747 stop:1025 length:279 start_codon:yes stop_codon:yes gene_type:complete